MGGSGRPLVLYAGRGATYFAPALHPLLQPPRAFVERRELAPAWLGFAIRCYCTGTSYSRRMLGAWVAHFASCSHRSRHGGRALRDFAVLWRRSVLALRRLSHWRRSGGHRSTAVCPGARGLLRWIFALRGFYWLSSHSD